jgi:hypothetical protein
MFETIAIIVLRRSKYRKMIDEKKHAEYDFSDEELMKEPGDCDILNNVISDVTEQLGGSDSRAVKTLLYDMRRAVMVMLNYMKTHLPLADDLVKHLGFLHPQARTEWTGPTPDPSLSHSAIEVANTFKRFSQPEKINIRVELSQYQALGHVPNYSESVNRVDQWWSEVFKVMERETGNEPRSLKKLVKMALVLAHSQGWIERGFSMSKRFAQDRNSLSVRSMKGLKLVHEEIKKAGGAEKVAISNQMLQAVKMAGREARQAEAEERMRKEREDTNDATIREAERKRKVEEESKKAWDVARKDIERELRVVQIMMEKKQKIIDDALSKATRLNDPYKVKDAMATVRLSNDDMKVKRQREKEIQEELQHHMAKRHRNVGM